VAPVWVEVLKKVYPALARHHNAVVGGSQVFYVSFGAGGLEINLKPFTDLYV